MHSPLARFLRTTLTAAVAFVFSGCVALVPHRTGRHQASSVVQFLYPKTDQPLVQPSIPTLRLPLRVGIAFAPAQTGRSGDMPEERKAELLRRVSEQFKALPFVQAIEIVPTAYLRPGGGFDNLDQLRAMLGVDVIALVGYDQMQNTGSTAWSLAYWTIVGAYIVPAEKNDTHTLLDAVVYDIASRKLLFRAPGTSAITGHATLIRTADELRADSIRGYDVAAKNLTTALQRELDAFKVRAKEAPASIRIEHKPGYTGGSLEGWFAALLAGLILSRKLRARR